MPEIYALYSPYPGAGKTTLAKAIEDYRCAEIFSFAGPMRYMVKALFQYATDTDFWLFYERYKECNEPTLKTSIRHMMRTLGTEWGRKCIRESFWVDIAEEKIKSSCSSIIIFDDLRFPNEYEMLKKHGAKFIKIIRPEVAPPKRSLFRRFLEMLRIVKKPHASDGALENFCFDLVIENTGTELDMYDKFKEWREVSNDWSEKGGNRSGGTYRDR